MLKQTLLIPCFLLLALHVLAQDALFGKTEKLEVRRGWILSFNGSQDVPGADMAKRFGLSNRAGASVYYKTGNNWLFGLKFDFIFGSVIRQDSFMINIKDRYGLFLTENGARTGVPTYERGYMTGIEVGKLFNISKTNPDNGILCLSSLGFMQHKIDIFDANSDVPQLRGDYLKGYDRLTNGLYFEEYVCYSYFGRRNKIVNFHIGLDATFGFTQGRRDFLFDVMRPDNAQRLDILFGIRGGWYIPIFKRKSEEIFY